MRDTVTVNGIILSSMPVGEADRRLSLVTKELGKISCFARGARKPTSRFVGDARPFNFGTFELLPGRDAYALSNANVTERFEAVTEDLVKSAYGSCFLELTGRISHENTDGGPALALLYYALKALGRGAVDPRLVKTVFEAATLRLEGYLPSFTHCAKCRKELSSAFFYPALMSPLCPDCAGENTLYPLSKSAVYALNFIAGTESARLFSFTLKEEVLKEVKDVVDILLSNMLGKPLKSAELLDVLTSV